MKIEFIKITSTNQILISVKSNSYSSLIFNGVRYDQGKETNHTSWKLFDFPEIITIERGSPKQFDPENSKFVLITPELASDTIPLEIPYLDVGKTSSYSDEYDSWENYDTIRPLYKVVRAYKEIPNVQITDAELVHLTTINALPDPSAFRFSAPKSYHKKAITANDVLYYLENMITIPKPLLGLTPCKLSKEDSLLIVREWVKNNIDSRYARVTSNYDSKFRVAKVLPNVEKIPYQVDVSTGRQKPRFQTRSRDNDLITNFYCISTDEKSTILEFQGENLNSLCMNIQAYLDDLMLQLNAPLHLCEHCNGKGIVDVSYAKPEIEGVVYSS